MQDKLIKIAGSEVLLRERSASDLKGINVSEQLTFTFYTGTYRDVAMLFAEPKSKNPTPRNCQITADRLTPLFGMPVVFILEPSPTYERQRLMDKNVYFVMSEKYAFLPMLVALERVTTRKR